jgi:hypothetical protein
MSNRSITTLGLAAGVGLCLGLASKARAGDYTYGHAEISLGFPNGQVTVGRTWDSGPREVVVEEVTHKVPDPDYDDEVTPRTDDDYDEDEVVIEKREHPCHHRHHRRVVVIEQRYREPEYCDREVHRVYVEPSCHRGNGVVVYRAPERVIYAPSRVIVAPPRYEHESRGGNYHGGDYGHGGSYDHGDRGPRNLFPEDNGRPARMRGVQRVAVH